MCVIYLAKIFNIKQVGGLKQTIIGHLKHRPTGLQENSDILQTQELSNTNTLQL